MQDLEIEKMREFSHRYIEMPKPRLHGVNRASIPDPISSVTQEINGVKRKITTSLTAMKSKRTKQKSALLHSDCTNNPPIEIQPSGSNTPANSLTSSLLQPKEAIDPELLKSIKRSILQGWKPPVQTTGTGSSNPASYTQTSKRVNECIKNPPITNSYKRSLRSTDLLPTWQPPTRKQSKTDMQKDNRKSSILGSKMDVHMQGWQPPKQKSNQISLDTELQRHQVYQIKSTDSSKINEDEKEHKSVDKLKPENQKVKPEFCLKQSMDKMVVQQGVGMSQVYEGAHQSHQIQSPEHSNTGEDSHEKEKRSVGNILVQLSEYPLKQQEHKIAIQKEDRVISQHMNEMVIDSLNFSPKNNTKHASDSDDYFIDNSQPKSIHNNKTFSIDENTNDLLKDKDQVEEALIMADINSEADMFDTQEEDNPVESTTLIHTKGKLDDNFHKYTLVASLEIPVGNSKLEEILCTPPNNEIIDFSECPTQKRDIIHSFVCEVSLVGKDTTISSTTGETNNCHSMLAILVSQDVDKIRNDNECLLENDNFLGTKMKFEKSNCDEEIKCAEKLSQKNMELYKDLLESSVIYKSRDKVTDEENNCVIRDVEQVVDGKVQDGLLLIKSSSDNKHTKEVKYNENVANNSSPVTKGTDKTPSKLGKNIQENIDDLIGSPLLLATSPNMEENDCKDEKEVDISRNEELSVDTLKTYREVPHENSSNDKINSDNTKEEKEMKEKEVKPKEIVCITNRNITFGNTEYDRAVEKADTEHTMQQDLNKNNTIVLALSHIDLTQNKCIKNTNEQVATDVTKNATLPSTFASPSHSLQENISHLLPTMITEFDEVVIKYENKHYDTRTAQKDDRVQMEPYTIEMDQEFDISPSQLLQIEDACKHEMSLGAIPGINDTGSLPVAAAIDTKLQNKTFVVGANQSVSGRTLLSHGVIPQPQAFVVPTNRPLPPTNWIKKIREDRQKLRSTIHEISRLNAMLMQVRREVWPGTRNPVDAPVKSDANRPGPSSRRF